MLLGLHTDGCLSAWLRRSDGASAGGRGRRVHFSYRSMAPLLKGPGSALRAVAAAPPAHEAFAGISADGRCWVWSLACAGGAAAILPAALPAVAAGDGHGGRS